MTRPIRLVARRSTQLRRAAALATFALLLLATTVSLAADSPLPSLPGSADSASEESDPTSAEAIRARLEAVEQEIAAVMAEATAGPADDARRAHLTEVEQRLEGIRTLLQRAASAVAAQVGTEGESAETLPSPDAEPSIFALNALYEARFEAERRQRQRLDALEASRDALAAARQTLEEADRRRREARSAFEGASDEASKTRAGRTLELTRLASRAAKERVHLRSLELAAAEGALEQTRKQGDRIAAVDERIASMRDALVRRGGSSGAGLAALGREETELRRRREKVERRLTPTELRLDAAQQRLSREAEPGEDLLAQVDALAAARDAIRRERALIDEELDRLTSRRTLWQRWEDVLHGEKGREDLEIWKDEAIGHVEALEQARSARAAERADVRERLEALEARIDADEPTGARARALDEQRSALAALLRAQRDDAVAVDEGLRLAERYLDDIRTKTGDVRPMEYVAGALRAMRDIWGYEITAVDEAPITMGSVVLALLLAGIGFWVSRRGATLVGRFASRRFTLDTGAEAALETITFYILLVSFTLLALRAVHFPLTAFTVLGGALAIGIGFGSQNVMNNFISGLILMLERPVRAGDVVEIEGRHGSIERIGARSTQIRSVDGRHIVVPNSFFLESNVVNWTLSDDLIRTKVSVGVAYGSPTRKVEELIQQVISEEKAVIQEPAPVILFQEFGDNSLNFDVHFWVRARSPMQTRKVESRIRFRIDELFREHEITIAFPQRDVHVDSLSPIEVRMVEGKGAGKADG